MSVGGERESVAAAWPALIQSGQRLGVSGATPIFAGRRFRRSHHLAPVSAASRAWALLAAPANLCASYRRDPRRRRTDLPFWALDALAVAPSTSCWEEATLSSTRARIFCPSRITRAGPAKGLNHLPLYVPRRRLLRWIATLLACLNAWPVTPIRMHGSDRPGAVLASRSYCACPLVDTRCLCISARLCICLRSWSYLEPVNTRAQARGQ